MVRGGWRPPFELLEWANVVVNKRLAEFRQDIKVVIAGVDGLDDLMTRILGGSVENQVAEDSCVSDERFFSDLLLEGEANPVCTECVGSQLSRFRAIGGREIRHDGKRSRSGNLRQKRVQSTPS